MLYFRNDYGTGAHPAVLEALCGTNMELTPGYGTDQYTRQAAETIRDLCGVPDAAVHFLMGGTQANKTGGGAASPFRFLRAGCEGFCPFGSIRLIPRGLSDVLRVHLPIRRYWKPCAGPIWS